MNTRHCLVIAGLLLAASGAQAATYSEDFSSMPGWEAGWLGTNSNLTNVYGVGAGHGNNPDGLWVGESTITFAPSFASTITSLSFGVAAYTGTSSITFFDSNDHLISTQTLTSTYGAFTNPGVYELFSVTSNTGISHFTFTSGATVGNTSIDNVVVTTASAVPEPTNVALMLAGLGVVGGLTRRRQARSTAA